MNSDLMVNFPNGKDDAVVCAHCGRNSATSEYTEANSSPNMWGKCSCPGHLGDLVIGLDEIVDLAERVDAFETFLEAEPCTHPRESCWIHSLVSNMCPSCRLRQVFFLYVRAPNNNWIDPGVS